MTVSSRAAPLLAAAALLAACSSSSGSPSSGPGGNGNLYGVCSAAPSLPVASLGMSVDGVFGFTLPVPAGQTQDVTLTVRNHGAGPATQLVDLTPQSSVLAYEGGSYPGTGGTCGGALDAGATCKLVVTLEAPSSGRRTSLVVLQYYDGAVFTTDAHQVEAVATTGAFATAPHAPLPAMPQNGGAAPLGKVSFVSVSFSDTPEDGAIQKFGDWLVTSSYWAAIGKDYGVGPGTHRHVRLSDPTPDAAFDANLAALVDARIASGALPDLPEAVYTLFLSQATTVTDVAGAGGWHDRSPGGHDYAVVLPGCSTAPTDILAQYTFVASHELIEAATDPSPLSGYDFGFGQGEVGDLCDGPATAGGYALPTIWSNAAAAKGGDPCIPASGLPYVGVDPSPRHLSLSSAKGSSAVVTLTGWSTAPVGDWVLEIAASGSAAHALTATFAASATDLVNNGESVQVAVTTDGSAAKGTSAVLQVTSYAPSGAESIQGVALVPITLTP